MAKNFTGWRSVFVLAQAIAVLVFSRGQTSAADQVVRFQEPEYRVSLGVGIALLMVERVGGTEGKVTVQYHTEDRASESGTDFESANGELTWEDGDGFPKPILIYLIRHDYHFTDRYFDVVLTSPEGAVLGEPQSAAVYIEDGFNLGCAGKLDSVSSRQRKFPRRFLCKRARICMFIRAGRSWWRAGLRVAVMQGRCSG
jgi:hypothetical protein